MVHLARAARADGLSFDQWWQAAIRPDRPPVMISTPAHLIPEYPCVIWPTDSADRNLWRGATAQAKEGWRRAYEQTPATRPEAALNLLAPVLAMVDDYRGLQPEPALRSAA